VHHHITDEAEVNSLPTALLSLCGKYWRVNVDRDQSGNLFFSGGGWSRFLSSNHIIQGEALVLRYEGNLVFTVKVFGFNGCQKYSRSTKMSDLQQEQGQSELLAVYVFAYPRNDDWNYVCLFNLLRSLSHN
jgi:hypothetical protein